MNLIFWLVVGLILVGPMADKEEYIQTPVSKWTDGFGHPSTHQIQLSYYVLLQGWQNEEHPPSVPRDLIV